MKLLVRGGDQFGVIGFGQATGARPCGRCGCGSGRRTGCGHRAGSRPARRRTPARSLSRTPRPPACSRGGPRCGPSAAAGTARPHPQSTNTPRSPPLASKLDPGHVPPGGDGSLVAFGRAVHGDLRGVPHPVQQVRRAAQGVADVEQPPDQRGDPLQRPPLVLSPAPGGRALVQRRPQPGQLRRRPAGRPPRPRPSRPAPSCRQPASAAATDTPTSCSPAAHGPPAPASCPARTSQRLPAAPSPAAPSPQRSGHHHRDTSYIPA